MSDPTNQYKHPVFPAEATRRGEIYGNAHGYCLSEKGLVYQKNGKDLKTYHGYYRFYFSNRDWWMPGYGEQAFIIFDPAPVRRGILAIITIGVGTYRYNGQYVSFLCARKSLRD